MKHMTVSLVVIYPTSSLSAHGDSYSKNVTTMSIYNCKYAYLYEPIEKGKRINLCDLFNDVTMEIVRAYPLTVTLF